MHSGMEFIPSEGTSCRDLSSILILPALSIGNVGQLAADLLICSLELPRLGYLDEPNVLPCVGNDPFGPEAKGNLTVALEVFGAHNHLNVIQQRSPVMKGKMFQFAENVAAMAKSQEVKEVIILSGLDLGKYDQRHPLNSKVFYISSATEDGSDPRCEQLGWQRLKEYLPSAREWQLHQAPSGYVPDVSEDFAADPTHFAKMPFAVLFSTLKAHGLKALCLLRPCAEGDNIPDAFVVAEAVLSFTGHEHAKWTVPLSWTTVYGPPPDMSIYS